MSIDIGASSGVRTHGLCPDYDIVLQTRVNLLCYFFTFYLPLSFPSLSLCFFRAFFSIIFHHWTAKVRFEISRDYFSQFLIRINFPESISLCRHNYKQRKNKTKHYSYADGDMHTKQNAP